MAEAQEQPQAQPQPEPASAVVVNVAEEPAHALPPASSTSAVAAALPTPHPPSQAAPAQHTTAREPQTWAPTPPEADTNAFKQQERIQQSQSAISQSPDAVRAPDIATTPEPAKEPAQEKGPEDQGDRLQHNHVSKAPVISTLISTPTTLASLPAPVTDKTAVAPDQPNVSTTTTISPSSSSDPSTVSQDQQSVRDEQQDKDGAVTPSPEPMAHNPPHIPGASRQPLPYSTSSAYAAGGMSNAHYGYPNTAPPTHDPYRVSPHAPSNNAMPLPSMRTFDPVQQQSQQQQHMAMAMPVSPVPSITGQPSLYYGQQVPMASMAGNPYASLSQDAMGQRYALPPSGPQVLTAGRHKKRRTKTGCLTCRKRRIKCDELHPTCKNCQKSKRECLGYDPIFKNNQQPQQQSPQQSPHQTHLAHQAQPPHQGNLHSAQNSIASTSASSPASLPHSASSLPASVATSAPAPLTPSTAASYATLPSGIASAPAPGATTYSPGLASIGYPAISNMKSEDHHYHTLDQSLDSVLAPSSMSTSHFPATTPVISHLLDYRATGPHLRGGGPSFAPLHPPSPPSKSPLMERNPAYSGYSVRKMKIQELVAIGNFVPPSFDGPLSQEKMLEVNDLFEQVYAPGLEKFFETEWYTNSYGSSALAANMRVQETLAAFLQSLPSTTTDDVAAMAYSANLEFRVVWVLATLVYPTDQKMPLIHGLPATDDGIEARNRVAVFETLLAGDFLDHNPLRPPLENADNASYHRNREVKFWHKIAEFLTIKDQPNIDMTPRRNHILAQLRELLDGRENRDVLYSLTILRALANKFPPDFESTLPPHLDESDPQKEARVSGGTTNVVRRFAELGVRAFIAPAYNITRQ
ncbi:hypothetical protein F4808DRAFT_447752 [Astrocystis sublimbata]|nr:hypothetical protein F4808DRAFT_447752 [Astrocystis sublimbata]